MKLILTFLLFLIAILSLSGQIIYKDTVAPKVQFTNWIDNPNGDSVITDKPIVLEFWSSWCGPCIKTIPHFNKLANKYKNSITFISVNSYETIDIVEKFLAKNPIAGFVALDEDKRLKTSFDVQSIPVTIIIDEKGMLRWRGIASELTDNLLHTFVTQNRFEDNYRKGVIVDKKFSVNALENLNYQLVIEYGDATLGKSVSINSDEIFYFKLSNYSIYSILNTFSDWFKMDNVWQYKGNFPKRDIILNLSIKSQIELNESDIIQVLKDAIYRLSMYFNFEVSQKEELQTTWYIAPDSMQLEKYISIDQSLELEVVETTGKFIRYQNLFFEYLASSLSIMTKEKVDYEPLFSTKTYDLTIPKSNDIKEMGNYLKDEYGIELVKKLKKVKVNIATFN